jgi:hypothetical protein
MNDKLKYNDHMKEIIDWYICWIIVGKGPI